MFQRFAEIFAQNVMVGVFSGILIPDDDLDFFRIKKGIDPTDFLQKSAPTDFIEFLTGCLQVVRTGITE